ncbi:MAG: 16S rRNA (guanine(966)-N(2))-methyltransferase RsmD [Rhodospirillaceae bacterium]|jgi:16S rRNA (guanine966-N2)-methyltransferase|nr:16S rRNA (guanine(966)-N(2))-methyltransferase RsmD [Rhodospirillaceae bacterium]
MRIVGGKNRGRALKAPKGQATRPTSDRTRESVFNILTSRLGGGFQDLSVVDLFAGTGALGLEALSRGARQALLVDNDRAAIKIIEENVRELGEADNVTILKREATNLGPLPAQSIPAGLVFLDPPYNQSLVEPALISLQDNNWLAEDALCIVEMDAKETIVIPDIFTMVDQRKYGKAAIHILKFTG